MKFDEFINAAKSIKRSAEEQEASIKEQDSFIKKELQNIGNSITGAMNSTDVSALVRLNLRLINIRRVLLQTNRLDERRGEEISMMLEEIRLFNKVKIPAENAEPADLSIIPEEIWVALENNGLIQREPLQWLKSKTLLAYFVATANVKLELFRGLRRQWQPFGKMFRINVEELRGLENGYKNKIESLPLGHEIIDKIFKENKK